MKRGWIGLGLLLVLLAGGLLGTWGMTACHEPMAEDLEKAAAYALLGDWNRAESLAQTARADWEACWQFTAIFADHAPMEEIDGLFAQLEVYEDVRDAVPFAAVCKELSREVQAMGDAHGLNWWNML